LIIQKIKIFKLIFHVEIYEDDDMQDEQVITFLWNYGQNLYVWRSTKLKHYL